MPPFLFPLLRWAPYILQACVPFPQGGQPRAPLSSPLHCPLGFPGGVSGKEPVCQCRRRKRHEFDPWVEKIPWKRTLQPTPVFLPGKSHEQRSLGGYSPWGRKESDMTEWLTGQSKSRKVRELRSSPGDLL